MSPLWPESRTDYLKGLHAEGRMTAAEMAASISERYETVVTRYAVIGKLNRLGLHGHHGGPRPNSGRPRKPRVARTEPLNPTYV